MRHQARQTNGHDAAMRLNSPATPTGQGQRHEQQDNQHASNAHSAIGVCATVLHILSKRGPIGAGGIAETTRSATLFETLHPVGLFQAKHADIAAHKAAAEDAAGQLIIRVGLQRVDMPEWNLRGLAYGLRCKPALFPRSPQLFAECRYSLMRHVPLARSRQSARDAALGPTLSDA